MKTAEAIAKEDVVYGVFTEFLGQHKTPIQRFVIYPQLLLK
jgi:hypothetical protein